MTTPIPTWRVFVKIDKGEKQTIATALTEARAIAIADNLFDAFLEDLGTRLYVDIERV